MLIDCDTQISKNTFNYKVINVNKINCISRDHRNNKNDIEFNVEHRIYKRFYNKLINFKQILENDIIFFDRYKTSVGFYEDELWFKFLYVILFKKTFDKN